MASRPQGCQSIVMAADGIVLAPKAGLNVPVYALVIATDGATAGDVVILRDGGPTGKVRVKAYVELAKGTVTIPLGRYGINFSAGIFYSELPTADGKNWTPGVFG